MSQAPGMDPSSPTPPRPPTLSIAGPDLVPLSQKGCSWPQCMDMTLPTRAQTPSPDAVGPCQAQAARRQRGRLSIRLLSQNVSSPCSLAPLHCSERPTGHALVTSCASSSTAPWPHLPLVLSPRTIWSNQPCIAAGGVPDPQLSELSEGVCKQASKRLLLTRPL